MKKHRITVCFTLAALMALCGCGGAAKYPNYYTLNVPPPPDPPAQEGVRACLAVREFRSPSYLHQGAIVYKTSPEQIGFYNYHRWAVDPSPMMGAPTSIMFLADGSRSLMNLITAALSRLRLPFLRR